MGRVTFSEEELHRIKQSVEATELKTSGEIVPFFVEASDGYPEANWKSGSIGGLFAMLLTATMDYEGWGFWSDPLLPLIGFSLIGALIGYFLPLFIPALKRYLVGEARFSRRVMSRAIEAFVAEEVFNTQDRTGILILISNLERRVQVLGDSRINKRVEQKEWDQVVERIVQGIKAKRGVDGIVSGIEMCGQLLVKSGLKIQPGDQNELGDGLRRE